MTPLDDQLALLNPVPDPAAEVDPVHRDRLRASLLDDHRDVSRSHVATRRQTETRRVVRRRPLAALAAAAAVLVATAVALLAGGGAPGSLDALASELAADGRILHTSEITTLLGPDGQPVRGEEPKVAESWLLLDDVRVFRFRIEVGDHYEEGASTAEATSGYDSRTNTYTDVTYPEGRGTEPIPSRGLPVQRLARGAADGSIPVRARVTIRGREALELRNADGVWYIAADAPVLLRRELPQEGGRVLRSDYLAFEIVEADEANRRSLAITPPAGAKRRTVEAPPQP